MLYQRKIRECNRCKLSKIYHGCGLCRDCYRKDYRGKHLERIRLVKKEWKRLDRLKNLEEYRFNSRHDIYRRKGALASIL